jgi:transposase
MYFAGIDVGKHHHEAIVVDQRGERCGAPLSFSNDRSGINTLLERFQALDGPVQVALGASGRY